MARELSSNEYIALIDARLLYEKAAVLYWASHRQPQLSIVCTGSFLESIHRNKVDGS